MVGIGLEVFCADTKRWVLPGARVGLLLNHASVDAELCSAKQRVAETLGSGLRALYGPQHGIRADVQDNMVESPHAEDPRLGIPIWSLYAEQRAPTGDMLTDIDVLLVDLQDVGCRVYTFIWTLLLAMRACGAAGVKVLVLDRPNPLGGVAVEGNLLLDECQSFVGLGPLPMRHGLTIGELCRWFIRSGLARCEAEVVPLQGWRREMLWADTGRPWAMPSPNMPTVETALVYPGSVLLEGTNASEGRGTTRPFEILGGPWVDSEGFADGLNALGLEGAFFRPCPFQPTFQKWVGQACGGVQWHVTDPRRCRPYRTGVAILSRLWAEYHGEGFDWRSPPYEYEAEKLPIHLLLGDPRIREAVESGVSLREAEALWVEDERCWREERRDYLLYENL